MMECGIPTNISNLNKLSSLDLLEIKGCDWRFPYYNLTGLENLSLISSFDKLLNIKLAYCSEQNLDFLEGFSYLKGIEVSKTDVSNISGISNSINLKSINLHDNKITDVNALTNMTECQNLFLQNMLKLETLNLENNAIYDISNGRSNLEILANLNKNGKLKTLKLAGNLFTNFDLVSGLQWTEWSGFSGK